MISAPSQACLTRGTGKLGPNFIKRPTTKNLKMPSNDVYRFFRFLQFNFIKNKNNTGFEYEYMSFMSKPERSQTATQGVMNPAMGALWLELILNPASSKPVFIASHTPPAPLNDITFPSKKRSTSITTPRCKARCGCATTARPGRPSVGCAVVGNHY